jgi:hypothetical protein
MSEGCEVSSLRLSDSSIQQFCAPRIPGALRALGAARDQHSDVYAAEALGWLAMVATLRAPLPTPSVHASAARILGFVEARLQTLGSAAQNHERTLATLREAIDANTVAKLTSDGANMTEDEAVELATTL